MNTELIINYCIPVAMIIAIIILIKTIKDLKQYYEKSN